MSTYSQHRIVAGMNSREPEIVNWVYTYYIGYLLARFDKLPKKARNSFDLAQEVFSRLLKHKDPFDSLRDLENTIRKIAMNLCINIDRHAQVEAKHADFIESLYGSDTVLDPFTEDPMDVFLRLADEAIDNLREQYKPVFKLYYYGKKTNEEIAQYLGMTVPAVNNIKHKAKKFLHFEAQKKKELQIFSFLFLLL